MFPAREEDRMALVGKVVVAQGGGPTAVINQSLVGVVLESRKFSQVTCVYGAINGVRGIINENFVDLTQETTHNLEQVAVTPSSALSSTRDKPDEKYCREIFRVLKAHDVRYFFYIGGNDSADTVHIVNEQAELAHYEFRAIHIPKTIDNDLVMNDHTPGYGSAARFVAQAFIGANLDNRALPGVYIAIIMGRHAGFLTAASSLARKYPDDGPHLVYLPERSFDMGKFLGDVKAIYDRLGRCVVAASEGIQDAQGTPVLMKSMNALEKDAHGNVQLSGTGALGAQFAIWHNHDGSITIQRTGEYSVDYRLVPLQDLAGKTRRMPDEFINEAGNNVTDAFRYYCRPLLGSGLQSAHRLRAPTVAKILAKAE
jgi:6-phosphofructokinase 1